MRIVESGYELGKFRIVPKVPEKGDMILLVRKEYRPFFKNGVNIKVRRRPNGYGKEKELKWPKNRPHPAIVGEHYHLELIGKKRITDIYVPIKIVPEEIRDNPGLILEWVQGNRWFSAIKFMNYTNFKTIVRSMYNINLKGEVDDILSKLLVGDELEDKDIITPEIVGLVNNLYGLKSVDVLFNGEREPPSYLLRGFDTIDVKRSNKIPYSLYVEYFRVISGSLAGEVPKYKFMRVFYSESEIRKDYVFSYSSGLDKVRCKFIECCSWEVDK